MVERAVVIFYKQLLHYHLTFQIWHKNETTNIIKYQWSAFICRFKYYTEFGWPSNRGEWKTEQTYRRTEYGPKIANPGR